MIISDNITSQMHSLVKIDRICICCDILPDRWRSGLYARSYDLMHIPALTISQMISVRIFDKKYNS
jgi:hypothetical protein